MCIRDSFDRGPILEDELITGGYWSVYYYEGIIYGTEITRGLDVLKLLPSEHMSENEIAAAAMAYPVIGPTRLFNPQQQIPMTWPSTPEVAHAYIDQLLRNNAISEDAAERIGEMLGQVKKAIDKGGDNRLARQINNYRLSAKGASLDALSRHRLEKLHTTLKEIAASLRD